MQQYVLPGTTIADVYGAGSFGNCDYNSSTTTCSGSSSGSSGGSGALANTGLPIAIILTVACVIALVAILVRFWRRPAKGQTQNQQARRPVSNIPIAEE